MSLDPRDAIWDDVWELRYDSVYHSTLAELVARRWGLFDQIAKVIIAIVVSGSAVSGWALWSTDGGRVTWSIIAGIAALLAIAHTSIGVSTRIRGWEETKRDFSKLKHDLDDLLLKIKANPQFDIDRFIGECAQIRSRVSDAIDRVPTGLIGANQLRHQAQDLTNVDMDVKGSTNGSAATTN